MEAIDDADEDAMQVSQPLLKREDRSRTRDLQTRTSGASKQPSANQGSATLQAPDVPSQDAQLTLSKEDCSRSQVHLSNTSGTLENPVAKEDDTGTQTAGPEAGGASASGCITAVEQLHPIKNLQPEFLDAILNSDAQLDYHTDALFRFYDKDSDDRLMVVDLKDLLPRFFEQLGCEVITLLDLFATCDLDRDGCLDRKEFKGFVRELIRQGQEVKELDDL